MSLTKTKGDLAETAVLADLVKRGYKVALPFGDDWDYDLIVCNEGVLERVQVKYTQSDGVTLKVKCVSYTITAGRQVGEKKYTDSIIDWLAVYDLTTDCCYYIPASVLGSGKHSLWLRLDGILPTERSQLASKFTEFGRLAEWSNATAC